MSVCLHLCPHWSWRYFIIEKYILFRSSSLSSFFPNDSSFHWICTYVRNQCDFSYFESRRGWVSMSFLRAGMTLDTDVFQWDHCAPAWHLVSLNHVNMILSQQWFVEHPYTCRFNMNLAIIKPRWWCVPVRFLYAGMTFDIPIIFHGCSFSAIILNSAMSATG